MNPPPISIGIFTALLKENGIEVSLFDTTMYPENSDMSSDNAKLGNLQVRPFDYFSRNVRLKETRLGDDLVKKVEVYKPDLIAISILECTYARSLAMLKAIEGYNIPIIAGGVFPTHAPELVLLNRGINIVCIGEGEEALVELCKRMSKGEDYSDLNNLYIKKGREIIRNPIRKPVDMGNLPVPDYSLFSSESFYRPMAGKVYKTIAIETNRGCPYTCSFCNSPSMMELYKNNKFNYFRNKSLPVIERELISLTKKWNIEYVYFSSDNFLVMSDREFDKFIDIYKDIRLPFWMQSRPEQITEYRIKRLKEAGCHRMSVGLEQGNYEFRKKVLNKKFDNDTMINASKIIANEGIPLTINNIIGFPDETRELIFNTIELNRKLIFDTTNCAVFAPFHGTPLQKVCLEKGYLSDDTIFGSINTNAPLDMPQLSKEEIIGLRRTFALYCRLPKKYWPRIQKAEKLNAQGDKILSELSAIYHEKYFG